MALQIYSSGMSLTSAAVNYVGRTAPLSLSCWVNSDIWSPSMSACFVGAYSENSTTAFQLGFSSSYPSAVSVWNWGGGTCVTSSGAITPVSNTWYHIAYVYNGTTHFLYVGGELVNSSTVASVAGSLTRLYINGYPGSGGNETSNSKLDDVIFFTRAISADEVKTLSSTQGASDGNVFGVFARYRFDELPSDTTVSSIIDYSGNNNALTLVNTGTTPVYIDGIMTTNVRPVLG